MPELPDIELYLSKAQSLLVGKNLETIRLESPFLLRSVQPPLKDFENKKISDVSRIGKRLVFHFDNKALVIHLMVAGRLRWRKKGAAIPKKRGLAAFDFEHGTLLLTEASTKKRASLYAVSEQKELANFDRGGLEVFDIDAQQFFERLQRENRTLKRALTDPRIFSGIGNAYSDEILFAAKLSPFKRTKDLKPEDGKALFGHIQNVLKYWSTKLQEEEKEKIFPEKVTAFKDEMAVHGRYAMPCRRCTKKIQRIKYASNECNYCAECQTTGKLLADRSLSQLLKKDWPKTLDELENFIDKHRQGGASSLASMKTV